MITGAGCSRYNSATYADEKNGNLVDRCSFRAACLRGLAFARVRKVEGTAIVADSTLLKAEVSLTEETPGQNNALCKYDARIGVRFAPRRVSRKLTHEVEHGAVLFEVGRDDVWRCDVTSGTRIVEEIAFT